MAEGTDVNEMFQKMGEKLGWFKDKSEANVKQGLSLSARKKTKMKKEDIKTEDGDFKLNGKNADKLKLKKKKTTAKSTGTSKRNGKTETKSKQSIPNNKAQTFQIFGSSDSDSSLTNVPNHKGKTVKAKAVLQMCSDSDDDFSPTSNARNDYGKTNLRKNHSDTCIKESFVDSVDGNNSDRIQIPTFEPILNIKPRRESSLDSNDTIVKNRVSLSSCYLDLDNLGDPLVESTRIHRRSSITYKKLMEEIESSPEDNKDVDTKRSVKESLKKVDEMLDQETSVCDETNIMYITAIESVDDTLDSSNLSSEKVESKWSCSETGKKLKHGNKCKANNTMESGNSESEEEIEVVDSATQTDEVITCGNECIDVDKESEKLVHRAYREETILDNGGRLYDFDNKYRDNDDVYEEETVNDSHVDIDEQSVHKLELTNSINDVPNIYSGNTIDQLGNALASTTINASLHNYSKETVAMESKSLSDVDVFNEVTALVDHNNESNQDTSTEKANEFQLKENLENESNQEEYEPVTDDDDVSIEDEAKVNAEVSVYEVNDAGTQTEDLSDEEGLLNDTRESNPCQNDSNSNGNDEDNYCSFDNNTDSDVEEENKSKENNTDLVENVFDESDTSEINQEKFANLSESNDSSDAISASFANLAKKSENKKKKKNSKKSEKTNVTDQSWRSDKTYSSDSSDDDNLESFFQKLRKPEPKKTPKSVMRETELSESDNSMDDFIVEDNDMTSDSDDSGYHLRQTQELENRRERSPRLSRVKAATTYYNDDDDNDSDDFSSKVYPSSVTKHKKQNLGRARKQFDKSWSFSSDSEESNGAKVSKSMKPKKENKPKDQKSTERSKNDKKSTLCIDFSSDSDNEILGTKNLIGIGNERRENDRKMTELSNIGNTARSKIHNGSEKSEMSPTGLLGSMIDEEPLFKTPNPLRKKKNILNENKENVLKTPVSSTRRDKKTPKSTSKPMYISLSDTDSEADDSSDFLVSLSDSSANSKIGGTPVTPLSLRNETISKTTPLSLKHFTTPKPTPVSARSISTCTFLKSLSNTTEDSRRHPDARRFVNNFKKNKEELLAHLFKVYNKSIFENKLPSDMPVIWNKRLLRTAGYCAYKKNAKDDRDRSTRIELSVKVCDNAERVRDTLIHEMCHAAVWLLNGVNGGHGSYWKYWARHATRVHPELPAVSVCHSYSINTKFTYRCKSCGYSIGRHSKSLDVKKKVCGYCRGEFELIQNSVPTTPTSAASSASSTPRPPNKFALFVKDNYNSVKRKNQDLKHGDVMKELSKLFAESKIAS